MGDGTTRTVADVLRLMDSAISKYAGKTALFLGDSITTQGTAAGNSYPIQVCNALGMTVVNKASSGGDATRMRNILQGLDTYTAPDLTNVDYVFIMIGHNCDGIYGVTAEGASIDNIPSDGTGYADYPNGFYSDVASCIEYIWDKKPDIQIYLITPIQSGVSRYIATTPAARKALMEIGVMYSVPVIDVFAEAGISNRNYALYTYDDVHPNEAGLAKIADYITAYLRSH